MSKKKERNERKSAGQATRTEKKEIQAVIRKYKGDGKPHRRRPVFPEEAMYQDGVCRVTPRTFSKCIEFTDISYQSGAGGHQDRHLSKPVRPLQLSGRFHSCAVFLYYPQESPEQYAKSFEIRAQGDDFDDIRSEYSDILQDQLVNGNNGLMKRKFMTYTIEADSLKMARARLRRIETDFWAIDKYGGLRVGTGRQGTAGSHAQHFHPDGEPFSFDWKWLAPSGLSTKDFHRPFLVPLRQCPDVRAGRQIRGGELSANPFPGVVGSNASRFSQYGKRHCGEPPCAGHRPERRY